jgi:uncharacterized protein (TIGR03000 family)
LTAGSESVDFGGRNRCHGCSAASACPTVRTTCAAASCGHRNGLFGNRCHGSAVSTGCARSNGCARSHGCASSCNGGGLFRGGLFHRDRCHGTTVCAAPVCGGAVIVDPKKEMPKGEKVPTPKTDKKPGQVSAPATIVINLPADARLFVDGNATTSTSERRTLMTPNLEFGSDYVYTMVAEVVRDGRTVSQRQTVNVRGGETVNVQFNFATQTVASR